MPPKYRERKELNMPGLLDGLLMCEAHDCPMIRIGDYYECVIEYTNSMLGREAVTDVIPSSGDEQPITLVFSNGRTLPLTCPCCGGPFHFEDEDGSDEFLETLTRQRFRLYALGYVPESEEAPSGGLELVFVPEASLAAGLPEDDVFTDAPEDAQMLLVHLDSVRGIA
jgi:hypothetical protein